MAWLKGLPKTMTDGGKDSSEFRSVVLSALFPVKDGVAGLEPAVDKLCQEAAAAVDTGHSILIISDRGVNANEAPIPMLLAVSAVHHH
ncbi:MAG: hypothetical protein GTO40_19235, partial [Deltaproteobacteria bacterium]|nr:hypothetical protein [Deltaproteobacteria bacterium]